MDYTQQFWLLAHQAWQWAIPNGLLDLAKALAAPVIAAAALRISRQQVRINERKLRLDMYDRRVKVYGAVKDIIRAFETEGTLSLKDVGAFQEQVAEADFLFDDPVLRYIRQVDENARRLFVDDYQYRRGYWETPPALIKADEIYDPHANIDAMQQWFREQPAIAKEVFKPYLSFEHTQPRGWFARFIAIMGRLLSPKRSRP